jgi:transcription antitermination protein NusB
MTDAAGSRWEGRRRAREAALRILYHAEIGGLSLEVALRSRAVIGDADAIALDDESAAYAERLATSAWADRSTLDRYIAEAALNWRVERLAVIDRIILRLAIGELLTEPATPPRVVIDEAIELARLYSGDESARFVNGVLDGVFKRLRDEGKVTE